MTYLIIAWATVAACGFSGVAAMLRWRAILPGMAAAGVPESWLVFPIGVLKTAGAIGVLIGVFGLPWLGTIAAFGLVLFFTCAVYTHLRARDYSPQFGLANGFLLLCMADLVVSLSQT